MKHNICVLGSGAWGTALADLLGRNGNRVRIYGICREELDDINEHGRNAKYFGESFRLCDGIRATSALDEALSDADLILFAVPSFAIRETVQRVRDRLTAETIIVNVAKGFDSETEQPLGRMIAEQLPPEYRHNVVSLLGPTFAEEVAERQCTAITASGTDLSVLREVQQIFSSGYFRVYINDDALGAEYCAALKNVIALACGIADGIGCKVNSRAALITRGLAEIVRFVTFFGGNAKTCYGLAGVGDLILTCSSRTSRNYTAGCIIGSSSAEQFFAENKKTVEGVFACEIAHRIAGENGIYAPIVNSVYNILFRGSKPIDEIGRLMTGDLKAE